MTSKNGQHRGISSVGLTSKQALVKLRSDIEEELERYQRCRSRFAWVRDAFHHSSPSATFPWTSAAILLCDIFLLVLYQVHGDPGPRRGPLALESVVLSLVLLHNVALVAWDGRRRDAEMADKIRHTLEQMEGAGVCVGGVGGLHAPPSPCISVQWALRDGRLLPLPTSLLVEGDTLLMRPGHHAPGRCSRSQGGKEEVLEAGEVFAPCNDDPCPDDFFHSPRLRRPARPAKFVLAETPCIASIRCALENSLKRPVTLFNKEYHAVVFYYMERIVLPSIIVVLGCACVVRAVRLGWGSGEGWAEHLLLRPALATLPLLPLTLPTCWTLLNAAGNARLLAGVHSRQCKRPVDPFDESEEEETGGGGSSGEGAGWWEARGLFSALLSGRGGHLWRSANLLQVLGSVTALCCVDKKGVLSWPNPTAEKVFFLRGPRGRAGTDDNCCPDEEDALPKRPSRPDVKDHIYHSGSQAEVLDLTHNLHSPFGIQFDDPNWKIYSDNLKPLGLGILLNTCNPRAQEHYTAFSDHIACESLYNEAAIPVVNKRCLCELAKQIGFVDSVVDYYDLQQLLGVFRHVHPEAVQKGARTLNFPRLKMPFPNMTCAILKDLHRGSQQLFSQGTADLILDSCNEYWDGSDIRPLTDADRKRILDFYHRSSLTAHCMGYAYSPLHHNNNVLQLPRDRRYIELPAEGRHLLASLDANTASPRSWDPPCPSSREVGGSGLHRHLSSDSLVEPPDEEGECGGGVEASLRQIGNGIFIGMVTMQYQACPDFVQLIEQLDKACIRFVHFSKENELRSRVFSEKMGLESGWNCHISLLSDKPPDSEHSKVSTKFSHHYTFPANPTDESPVSESRSEIACRHASAPSVVHLESGDSRGEETPDQNNIAPARVLQRAESLTEGCRRDSSSLLSHSTDSTEQSAPPLTFDMSNRAKLPKGVENIRPHILHVDNVPLQVSLFTDCTEEGAREMIEIMQECGEVVCCVGSAANARNAHLFLQADASIAVEPLVPQLCSQQREGGGGEGVGSALNSLPCCLLFRREDPVSLHRLIVEARQLSRAARSSLEFLVCCSLCVSGVQGAGALLLLPPPLPSPLLLWMCCAEIPLLATALLLDRPHPPANSACCTGKNIKPANRQALLLFCGCFCVRFCPSAVVALLSFACILSATCATIRPGTTACWPGRAEDDDVEKSWLAALTVSQNIFSFLLVTYFAVISVSYLHRSRPPWKSSPLRSKFWMAVVMAVLLLHLLVCLGDVWWVGEGWAPLSLVPSHVWLVGGLWPLFALPLNELVRRHEIKVNVRQQKRARLEFCTKLGMNSPF